MKTSLFLLPFAMTTLGFTPAPVKKTAVQTTIRSATSAAPSFSFLRTHRQGKGITATWGMTSTNEVAGFTVQRTYEDPTDPFAVWEESDLLPCDASRSFTYTDKEVFPGIIHYRIVAFLYDGSTITSDISDIRIVSRK